MRDDGKGGQLIKAKCGADIELHLFRGIDPQPLLKPDVKVKVSSRWVHQGGTMQGCFSVFTQGEPVGTGLERVVSSSTSSVC